MAIFKVRLTLPSSFTLAQLTRSSTSRVSQHICADPVQTVTLPVVPLPAQQRVR